MSNCVNAATCPCTYACKRHGKCCECVAYHRADGEFPACFFTKEGEKTYDRSLSNLLKDRNVK
ncbi:MAG TPA: DUF6485 family protein [Clostridia bacterium]|nr:DUF6485 family protein [Clostridia bacterium]